MGYAPFTGDDSSPIRPVVSIWVPAQMFTATVGSPTLSFTSTGLIPGWLLDATSDETVTSVVHLPKTWATFTCTIRWTNVGAGSGNVVWIKERRTPDLASGVTLVSTAGGSTSPTVAAPAQWVVAASTLSGALSAPTTDVPVGVSIGRVGSTGADTLANDVLFMGVTLDRAS